MEKYNGKYNKKLYKIDNLFKIVLFILKTDISYKNITELNIVIH